MNHHRKPPPGPQDEIDPRWGLVPLLLVLAALTTVLLLPHDKPPPATVAAMPLGAEFPMLPDTGPAVDDAASNPPAVPAPTRTMPTEEDQHAPTF